MHVRASCHVSKYRVWNLFIRLRGGANNIYWNAVIWKSSVRRSARRQEEGKVRERRRERDEVEEVL